MFVNTIQPVVMPIWQQVVSCKQGLTVRVKTCWCILCVRRYLLSTPPISCVITYRQNSCMWLCSYYCFSDVRFCQLSGASVSNWWWRVWNITTKTSDYISLTCLYLCLNLYVVSQKTQHLTSDHTFGKYRPLFKILSLADPKEIFYMPDTKTFCLTSSVLLHYHVKVETATHFSAFLHVRLMEFILSDTWLPDSPDLDCVDCWVWWTIQQWSEEDLWCHQM